MNTRSLQCFLTAAEEMNFSRAAQRLYISQQSLSAHIKNLEETYDVLLFERSPHLRLTYAGERMMLHARNILTCEHHLENEISYISENKISKLSIGISRSRSQVFLPLIWERFSPQNPNVNISLVETISDKMENLLLTGAIDLYIGVNVIENKNMEKFRLAQEQQYCILSKDLLLKYFPDNWDAIVYACRNGVGLSELLLLTKIPFVLLPVGNRMRTSLDYILHSNNIVPRCIFETMDQNLTFQLSQNGVGVGFISQSYLYNFSKCARTASSLYIFPVNIDAMGISIDLVTLKSNERFSHVEKFILITKEIFEEYTRQMSTIQFNQWL